MASTYSTNLGFELPGTGDQAGTWGITNNTNIGTLIEQAISGYVTQAITDGADTTITIPNGASGVARNMTLELTGSLSAARNLIVPANKKLYFIFNNTTGGYAVTVKVSGQTGVSVPNGQKMVLVCNGTDVVTAVTYAASLSVGNLSYTGTLTGGTGVVNIGSGQVYKDASGNVGIGTASPSYRLDVAYDANANSSIRVSNSNLGTSATATLRLETQGGTWTINNGRNGGFLSFSDSGGERARFDNAGNLGIGTASPSEKLEVSGTVAGALATRIVNLSSDSAAVTRLAMFTQGGTWNINANRSDFSLAFATGTTERMRLDSSGNLGIGTASPGKNLEVAAATDTTIRIRNTTTNLSSAVYGTLDWATSDSSAPGGIVAKIDTFDDFPGGGGFGDRAALRFFTNNSTALAERMRLDSSGNLGIGTASPAYRLHVVGGNYRQNDATNSYGFELQNGTGTSRLVTISGGSAFAIQTGGNAKDYLNLDGNGSVTIGDNNLTTTSTNGFLYVPTCAGTPTGTPTAKTGFAPIVVNTTNNKLYFYSGGVWRDAGP